MGPGSVKPAFLPRGQSTASAHNLPVLYIYPLITRNKPVYTEPLSVTVPVVFGTCTVLLSKIGSEPGTGTHYSGMESKSSKYYTVNKTKTLKVLIYYSIIRSG